MGDCDLVRRNEVLTDKFFIAAAKASADRVGPADRDPGMLPPFRPTSWKSRSPPPRVAEYIFDQQQANVDRPTDVRAWLESLAYKPQS